MAGKFYVTTSIAYTNARPHIGFAMEVVQADVLARYHRLLGDDTFSLTGTDEHGMKIMQAAETLGKTPQEFVDEISSHFRDLGKLLNLSNDHFIRTTDADHVAGVTKIWLKLVESGDIYKNSYEGLYCIGCEAFILEKDLVDGKCPNHNRVPEKLKEENYFFKLSKYSDVIKQKIVSGDLKILPEARKNEILTIFEEGLKDVSFSRPKKILQWGIEVPNDPDQVMYVWCDALSNYMTGVGYESDMERFHKFWPADVQLIGKDILRFHAAIWQGMLLSMGLPMSRAIYVHGFITSEGKKMSKSLNNVVDPFEIVGPSGADAVRYYLLKEIPTTTDGDFSKARFQVVYDSELADTIGNLVSRVVAMTHKYFEGKVPQNTAARPTVVGAPVSNSFAAANEIFVNLTADLWKNYDQSIADFDLKKTLEEVINYAMEANKYVDTQKPWALAKSDQQKLAEVIYVLLEMIRHIGLALLPFIPAAAEKILGYLGSVPQGNYLPQRVWGSLKPGTVLQKAEPLFPKKVA